ncbi:hypothetical protein A3C23_02445 [Candidatus Roizmanbacteria bacterium RIFCSPHIGHO2_02_FULL_37_13b]|uniref:HEPN domain-containing protein n=1 Tax=Candidatus Roizmanbacteria bacterium RIFCSPLOWO2_02_FULL_36_11 TaxID=1802071 RepID=A0A1F7JIP4_9BACT|nr:MAG: hypothetical protein A3C23_02445 [Candidatus Roizmanbacteria bacterium RIFCSPHIGHO2_02_FULL_37_13b]OGK55494.1 MAG: hypothetical protein A3H78_04990 [Candidatus Roizmanbacteria bacterium RIFCSPLOWO2_02_FULL_36_11]
MKKETELWFDLAEEDFENMHIMAKSKRLRGTVIFAQQSVEKILKAYIAEFTSTIPPKTHFIEKLVQVTGLDLNEINNPSVESLSTAYSWARYADIAQVHFKKFDDIKPLLVMAETVYLWVKTKLIKL